MGGNSAPHQSGPNGACNNDMHNEVRDGISDEDESRINESGLGLNDSSHNGAVTPLDLQVSLHMLQQQQQQQHLPPGPVVRWDRILAVRTLKVLLVESDDSTRQVVSALLRNCSYEVTAAADGLQAWKILENPANHIDLVLTEVAMPSLNGISLLSKIMSNDSCKNIPVIMMSSNDSMGTVFKCLSKGAVDFLVKPIRKNELKNLWQHVWRRSHSSSGSVSESGIQTQRTAKSKSVNDSDNSSSSDDEDDNASMGLNARDGSDNGSGTQSSWTKHAVEINSPQPLCPSDQLAHPHDSTCAQVISDSEIFPNKWMPSKRDCQKQKKHADELMGKDLEIGVPRIKDLYPESHHAEKKSARPVAKSMDNQTDIVSDTKHEDVFNEPSTKAADLIGGIAKNTDRQLVNDVNEPGNKGNIDSSMELPSLQLSLKRLRSPGDDGNTTNEERNILRRSDQSAFSRYRTSAASTQAPTGCVGSCSPVDNSSEALKTESTQNNMVSNTNLATAKQGSNGSSDNNDKGLTTNPATYKEKAASKVAIKGSHPSAFHSFQVQFSPQQITQENIDEMEANKHQYQVQHHHHHYHHHHHHVHSAQKSSEHGELAIKNRKAGAYAGLIEGNGSNSGSNGQNGSGTNAENANGITENCGDGNWNGSGSGSGSGIDQNRTAQREAALIKFRQKRKERNFGKKVRYYSRKKLAEQRPRVRGQFVRQPSVQESKSRGDS